MIDLQQGILVLDFGSQYTQLIARRIREARVYCEIHPPTVTAEWVRSRHPKGIILSGGPRSVYEEDAPQLASGIVETGSPILGAPCDPPPQSPGHRTPPSRHRSRRPAMRWI